MTDQPKVSGHSLEAQIDRIEDLAGIGSPRIVISVHGIRTRGEWQKMCNRIIQDAGFQHEIFDYGYFSAFSLLRKKSRENAAQKLLQKYTALKREIPNARFYAIGHSHGTLMLSKILKYSEVSFERMILTGSIVDRKTDWINLFENNQVGQVLNLVATKDWISKLGALGVRECGVSGLRGFEQKDPRLIEGCLENFGHSGAHYELAFSTWMNFLKNGKYEGPLFPKASSE